MLFQRELSIFAGYYSVDGLIALSFNNCSLGMNFQVNIKIIISVLYLTQVSQLRNYVSFSWWLFVLGGMD
jgi:hypothetical protein